MPISESEDSSQVLVGLTVTGVMFDGSVRIEFGEPTAYVLRCESEIVYDTPIGSFVIRGTPLDEKFAELLKLVGLCIVNSRILEDGRLDVAFHDGSRFTALPDLQFEAWQLSGPGGFSVVSLPGGETAIWSGVKQSSVENDGET